jgi:hypothetical protein
MNEDRKKQINIELFLLKIELNSFYGEGISEVKRCEMIFERTLELREELNKLEE